MLGEEVNAQERRAGIVVFMDKPQDAAGLLGERFAWSTSLVASVARKEVHDLYIGRSTRGYMDTGWGNKHAVSGTSLRGRLTSIISCFDDLVVDKALRERLAELNAKVLGCWCSPKLCHGHMLSIASHEGIDVAGDFVDSLVAMVEELPTRILVTGSRSWGGAEVMKKAFNDLWRANGKKPITLVVGDAKGADEIARGLWESSGWPMEVFIPDWEGKGKSAGPKRNAAMIASGVDGCLAFADGDTPGTQGCIDAARKAGVIVKEFRS